MTGPQGTAPRVVNAADAGGATSVIAPGATPAALREALERMITNGGAGRAVNAVSASLTFGWRALLKIKHVPLQLFDVTAFPLMTTVMFTYLFGGALAGSTGAYLQFVIPGIVVQTVMFITVYTGMGLSQDISTGVYDRFRSLPIWQPAPIIGAMLGDMVRYSIAAAVVLGVGFIMGFRPSAGVLGVLAAIALLLVFAFSVSWLWSIAGILAKTPENVMAMSMMVLFPLTFVSNVFVDPATMPAWLQTVVGLNPVTHLVTASRGFMHGGVDFGLVGVVLLASMALNAVFAPIAIRMYRAKQ